MEKQITEHSEAFFNHGICPDCLAEEMSTEESKMNPPPSRRVALPLPDAGVAP